MLKKIQVGKKSLNDYKHLILEDHYEEIRKLSRKLKGLRVCHINATEQGGGVAEILTTLTGLMQSAGMKADWYVIPPPKDPVFFEVTKSFHNALQGKRGGFLTEEKEKIYLEHNKLIAQFMDKIKADIWVVHDPQPLASINYLKNRKSSKIARIHIDTSHPNKYAWNFIGPILQKYERAIFTMQEFVPSGFPQEKVKIFYPAIDPLSDKNRQMNLKTAEMILEGFGINVTKPLMAQVARFDPWKDPLGVIDAYYKAKNEIPDLQLALVGLMIASDDPEAVRVFKRVKRYAKGDPDIFLFANADRQITDLSIATFVNAFQTASDVILAKSTKEGFGLVVTEAMWKGKPVIGGNVGGIKVQIEDGKSGFLVNSSDEAAKRVVELLRDPKLSGRIGVAAKKRTKENFLTPRLLLDYMRLFDEIT